MKYDPKEFKALHKIDEAATDRMEQIVRQMTERDGVTEQMKASDPMKTDCTRLFGTAPPKF